MFTRVRPLIGAALAAVLAIGLAACTGTDPGAEAYKDGETVYSSNDLRTVEIPPADRGAPVDFGGTTESGAEFSGADARGGVTVVNFWYATCGPCRVEAKDLEAVWQKYQDQDVTFIGVNIYDSADTAKAFNETFGITYPSILDADGGEAKLAFAKDAPLQAPPVTLVLDREGRVAARIIGPIGGTSILSTMIGDVLEESA
ncbi:MAG: TlpA disulfide reductase family protein [Microbacterium sp.]